MRTSILSARIARGLIVMSCIILAVDAVTAADQDARTGAEAFFKVGAGARAASLGGAFIAIADDATATYRNPAGLTQLRRQEFHTCVTQVSWSGTLGASGVGESTFDNKHYFQSFAYPSRPVAVGLDFMYFGIGDIEIRKDRTTVEGSFDNSNWAASLSLGHETYRGVFGTMSLGIRYSLLHQSFSGIDSAWGHAISCGMMYVPKSGFWRVGMTVRNLYGNMKWRKQPIMCYVQ